MVHEKIFTVPAGGQVKIIVRGYFSYKQALIGPFIEIWVKQYMQANFSNPGELNLPRYGSLEKDSHVNIRELAVRASGITNEQFDQVISEFDQITRSSVLF
ncbi:hypothetical protein [Dyadobacter sp. CY326]|uniref:hypothetical protein n=1 Tax=Dyadobacter sp. CY326 TaxID=2907300 RepID=UPI001F2E38B1|nr:hypothetical protein [Dyadobacter sp. CY326]MCE7065194.1 hypothetical protein [Dyadobacter sp. CY326]